MRSISGPHFLWIWTEYRDLHSTLSAQTMLTLTGKISGDDETWVYETWSPTKIYADVVFTNKINHRINPNARKYGPEKTPHLDTFHHWSSEILLEVDPKYVTSQPKVFLGPCQDLQMKIFCE